jgi:hypothetical protein
MARFDIYMKGSIPIIRKKAGKGPLHAQRRQFYEKGVTVKDPDNHLEDWYPPHMIEKIRTWVGDEVIT